MVVGCHSHWVSVILKTIGRWPVGGIDCVQNDDIDIGECLLAAVRLVDEMDEQMWTLLQRNLAGVTEAEADWRPHPAANSVRWMVGHLAWFEEWAHDALRSEGRYLIDRDPTAYLEGTIPELTARFGAARARYRTRLTQLDAADLDRHLSYFARYDVSEWTS